MTRLLRCGGLVLVLGVLGTALAFGQRVPQLPPSDSANAWTSKVPLTGEITGKVLRPDFSAKGIRVAAEYPVYEPNKAAQRSNPNQQLANLVRQQYELQRRQVALMQSRNPREQIQRWYQLQLQVQRMQLEVARLQMTPQESPFKVVMKRQDLELQTDEHTKVRFLEPPVEFDDQGNLKKHTPAELRQLKGPNPNLPGYQGDLGMLAPGHLLRVTLAKKPPAKPAPKDLDGGLGEDVLSEGRPYAAMILVTGRELVSLPGAPELSKKGPELPKKKK